MEELFRFTMTEEDFQEHIDGLARCNGSRTRAAVLGQQRMMWGLCVLLLVILWLVGVLRSDAFWIALIAMAVLLGLMRLFAVQLFVGRQMRALRRQKKKAKSAPGHVDKEHRVFLRGGKYVHQIGQQVVDAIPLACLRDAKPAGKGGAALLFEGGMEDYLPLRLFGPGNPVELFCHRMVKLASAARQAPQAEEDTADKMADAAEAAGGASVTGQASTKAGRPRPFYTLRYTLDGQQAVRLFSEGNVQLFFLPQRWKNYTRSFALIGLVLVIEWVVIGPAGALCVAALPLALVLGPALPPVSRFIYNRRLRSGKLDSMLGEQQVDFYENSVVIHRRSGEYEQKYELFLKLMETADGWFLVGKSAASMLPLPKESLPESQHAAFAAFVEQKLDAAAS